MKDDFPRHVSSLSIGQMHYAGQQAAKTRKIPAHMDRANPSTSHMPSASGRPALTTSEDAMELTTPAQTAAWRQAARLLGSLMSQQKEMSVLFPWALPPET